MYGFSSPFIGIINRSFEGKESGIAQIFLKSNGL
jgi:hypothetical protein